MIRKFATTKANPSTMPENGLLCAIAACEHSEHLSDRQFALDCKVELERRVKGLKSLPDAWKMVADRRQRMRDKRNAGAMA